MKTFAYYNYQFGKIYNRHQDCFEDGTVLIDPAESFGRKQEILGKLLLDDCSGERPITFVAPRGGREHRHKWICQPMDEIYVMRISNRRRHRAEDANFNEVETDEYQSAIVIIDNRDGIQRLLVEVKPAAFTNPNTLAKIVEVTLSQLLAHYNLSISVDLLYWARAFWQIACDKQTYPLGFKKIVFKLPPINLERLKPAVDHFLPFATDVREAFDSDLAVAMTAPRGASLPLDPDNPKQALLVKSATEEIGGNVIKLYPRDGSPVEVDTKNYITDEMDDSVFDNLKDPNMPDDKRRAIDIIKAFTRKGIN